MRGKFRKQSQEILKCPRDLPDPSYQPFYLALHPVFDLSPFSCLLRASLHGCIRTRDP